MKLLYEGPRPLSIGLNSGGSRHLRAGQEGLASAREAAGLRACAQRGAKDEALASGRGARQPWAPPASRSLARCSCGVPRPNYGTMTKQGAIILGIGGDNSNRAAGTFYEGAVVAGYSSNATDVAVHADIIAAKYRRLDARSWVVTS